MCDNGKMKRRQGSHGAVTVFLTLVLIPCMIFVCAFGDISRVMLSKSQANAAADLAMSSLLSNYDEELKEWYGLVASVQSIDQFYDTTESYFEGMMSAAGMDGAASDKFSSFLAALRTGGSFVDFLQVDSENTTEVTAMENGAMGQNPALIEDGIVEFMKYRGPVEITKNLIDRFSSLNVLGSLGEASENEPIVEKKQEYAEAEGEMMDDILNTYLACLQYQKYYFAHEDDLDVGQYSQLAEKLSNIQADLLHVTELMTEYYAFTNGITNISGSFTNIPKLPELASNKKSAAYENTVYRYSDIGAQEDPDNEGSYKISEEKLTDLIANCSSYCGNIRTAANNIARATGSIPAPDFSADDNVNPAVYCMKIQRGISNGDLNAIKTNSRKIMVMYAKILLALECQLPAKQNPLDSTWQTDLEEAKSEIEGIFSNYLTYSNRTTQFETILSQYAGAASRTVDAVKERRYEFDSEYTNTFHGVSKVTVGQFFQYIRENIGVQYTCVVEQIANIDLILNGGKVSYRGKQYTVVPLNDLKESIQTAYEAREAWGTEAKKHDNGSNNYAKDEVNEYNGEGNTLGAVLRSDPETLVEELHTRLLNIRGVLQSVKDAMDGFTYGGKTVHTLSREPAVEAAKTVIPTDVDQIDAALTANETAARGYNSSLVSPAAGQAYTAPVLKTGKTGNCGDLNRDPPELYLYMKEAFPENELETAVDEKSKAEGEGDAEKDAAEEEAKNAKGVNNAYLNDLGANPLHPRGGDAFSAGEILNGIVGAVQTILGGNFDEFRDQLYFVEYVMDMFSYSSYNNEGQYRLALAEDKQLTYKDFNPQTKCFNGGYNDTWKTANVTQFQDNLSLTNRQISSVLNHANLAEVEYVLYGNSTNEENLKKAYGQIFAIREALNLVSGFQNFYTPKDATGTTIELIAEGIATLTMGLVPAPLTKCVLIGILATLESCHDLDRLKAGVPVAVYKEKPELWVYSVSGNKITGAFQGGGPEPDDPNGMFYSDYITLFLIMGAQSPGLYKQMLLRTGDLIEANMIKGGQAGFDLDKSQVYFSITSTLRVKPLLLTLPMVDTVQTDGVTAADLRQEMDWCTYEISVIRGYS